MARARPSFSPLGASGLPERLGRLIQLLAKLPGVGDKTAQRYESISYLEVLEQGLKVMDATAISLCMDNKLPIVVFKLLERGSLRRVIMGEGVGTTVTADRKATGKLVKS